MSMQKTEVLSATDVLYRFVNRSVEVLRLGKGLSFTKYSASNHGSSSGLSSMLPIFSSYMNTGCLILPTGRKRRGGPLQT